MKGKKFRESVLFVQILIISLTALLVLLQSCKNQNTVQPPENPPAVPQGPALSTPGNETTIQTFDIQFSWQSYASASSYKLMVSMDANFATGAIIDTSGLTSTSITVHNVPFLTGIYYYWRVIAVTPEGNSPWSPVWRYRIVLLPPPAPQLSSPSNGAVNQSYTPLFEWNVTPTADFYRLQVAASSNFSPVLYDSNRIPVTQLLMPPMYLNPNLQYFWRVNASNSQGLSTGPWSSVWNFTTVNGPVPNSIKGVVTFVDTNFAAGGSYYASAYTLWPPAGELSGQDSLIITKVGNVYQASYLIRRLYNGNYVVAVTYSNPLSPTGFIMGIYGCDTAHVNFSACPQNPQRVLIQNNYGRDTINYLTWADTTQRIF